MLVSGWRLEPSSLLVDIELPNKKLHLMVQRGQQGDTTEVVKMEEEDGGGVGGGGEGGGECLPDT